MLQLKVKVTKSELQQGQNKYGEQYSGYQCVGLEVDVPEGQYQNKVPFYVKDQVVKVGDVGTVNIYLDLRQYNGRDYADTRINGWQPMSVQGF